MPLLRSSPTIAAALMLVATSTAGFGNGAAFAADITDSPVLSYDLPEAEPAAVAEDADTASADETAQIDEASLECLAKVVHHESRGQPHRGQVAVAQTLINRLKAGGKFGNSICAVANQRGQFFNTSAYRPSRDSSGWDEAVSAAREVLSGRAEAAAPGAMFFHAAYAPSNQFFRSRQRVAAIGGQIFYR